MCLPSLPVVQSRYGSCHQKKKRSLDSPVYLLTGRSSTLHRCHFQIYSKSLLLTYELVSYLIVACYWISKVRTNTFFVNIWSRLKLVVFFVSQDINTWLNVYSVVVLYRAFPNHTKIGVWSLKSISKAHLWWKSGYRHVSSTCLLDFLSVMLSHAA